jgi:sugar phosphate permease
MKPTRTRFIVLAGLCMAAALAYLTRNAVGTAESTIRTDLGLTKEQSGWLSSAFFWSYALCQIPAAALSLRLGARRALPLFAVLWSLATALFGMGGFTSMVVSRALMGVAQAGLVPVAIAVMARWFPRTGQGLASGAFGGFMSAGSIVGAPLTAWMIFACGWRPIFLWYALPGIVWAVWFTRWYRNDPAEHAAVNAAERQLITADSKSSAKVNAKPPAVPWRLLITSPAMWCICVQQAFRSAGYIFFGSWFTTYLQEARGVELITSGWLTALPLIGDLTGSLFGGAVSDAVLRRTGSQRLARQGIPAIALFICACLVFSAWFVSHALSAVLIISLGMFCAAVGNPCVSTVMMHVGGSHVATISGVMNMCGNLGAAAFPVVVPWLLANAGGWDAVLICFTTLYAGASLFWLMMKTKPNMFDGTPAEAAH